MGNILIIKETTVNVIWLRSDRKRGASVPFLSAKDEVKTNIKDHGKKFTRTQHLQLFYNHTSKEAGSALFQRLRAFRALLEGSYIESRDGLPERSEGQVFKPAKRTVKKSAVTDNTTCPREDKKTERKVDDVSGKSILRGSNKSKQLTPDDLNFVSDDGEFRHEWPEWMRTEESIHERRSSDCGSNNCDYCGGCAGR